MPDPKLELRAQRHRIDLVQGNGQTRPVIGSSEPAQEDDARARAALSHGGSRSPRQQPQGALTQPLPLRTQTILSHRLPEHLQRALNEGLPGTGRVPPSGVVASVDPD